MAYVFQKYPENLAFQLLIICYNLPLKFHIFLISTFLTVCIVFLFLNKTLRLNNLNIRRAMNVKISAFVICIETIYL